MAAEEPTPLASSPITRVQRFFTRVRFPLAAIIAVVLLLNWVNSGPFWPGVTVALFGEFWQLWAAAHLHKNVTMVRSGPYALMRNPMYFGRFFVGLGFVLLTHNWLLALAYAALFAVYAQARVLGEEERLRGLFGEEYEAYCRTVNRWFPWPRTRGDGRRWSWEAVRRNHQMNVSAGVVAMLVLLWLRVHLPAPYGLGH